MGIAQADHGEEFDLEVAERCGWCSARPEIEERTVVFVNPESCQNGKNECHGRGKHMYMP